MKSEPSAVVETSRIKSKKCKNITEVVDHLKRDLFPENPVKSGEECLPKKELERNDEKPILAKRKGRPSPLGEIKPATLEDAAKQVKAAMEKVIAAAITDADLGESCDGYTTAARSFAELMLAERIRRKFAGNIDPKSDKFIGDAAKKTEFSREVREWLIQWNFGLAHRDRVFQIRGGQAGGEGQFKLRAYGAPRLEISRWDEIRALARSPRLADITQHLLRDNLSEKAL